MLKVPVLYGSDIMADYATIRDERRKERAWLTVWPAWGEIKHRLAGGSNKLVVDDEKFQIYFNNMEEGII